MDLARQEYGRPNPNAPPELSQFAFLIGNWRCDVKVKGQDGVYEEFRATWTGRYILDGYVITDEFRRMGPDGEVVQLGANYRSYSSEKSAWIMKWHDALASTWLDLGPDDLGGVQVDGTSITYQHHVPPNGLVRMFIFDISPERFSWRADFSTDGGESWDENVYLIEAYRIKD